MGTVQYDFTDETVVITGATSGIGRAVALEFGSSGAVVINGDREVVPKDAELPTHEAIEGAGGRAEFVKTDVTGLAQLEALASRADEYGGIDVWINNAGVQLPKPMADVTAAEFDRVHAVNSRGVFFGTQIAAKRMLSDENPGTIINTASISSSLAQHGQVPYDASKGAVRMITRGAALEYGRDGIRVNAVAPGQIATEFTPGWSEKAKQAVAADDLLKPVPLGRAGVPADLPGAYLFLASENAAYITGEMVYVDGGWQIC